MNKVFILAVSVLWVQMSVAQIREFQTSRLISTGGAGVASILSTEAAVLNPAASAFFQDSSFSYQSYRTTLQKKNDQRSTAGQDFPATNRSQGFFLSDNSGPVKGGMAYLNQNENFYERKRIVLHGAAPMGMRTAIGASYSFIEDSRPPYFSDRYKSHHQASIGITHVLDPDTVIALVILDPTRTTPREERAIVGFQYTLADRFTLIGDVGAQFTRDASENYLWRGAVQMNIFSDFFLRIGQFFDNIQKMKGTGWGVSWMGPRFGVEFSQRQSQQFDSGFYVFKDEKILDSSLSALIKF
jgi:hypothetical protein